MAYIFYFSALDPFIDHLSSLNIEIYLLNNLHLRPFKEVNLQSGTHLRDFKHLGIAKPHSFNGNSHFTQKLHTKLTCLRSTLLSFLNYRKLY